MKYEEAGLQYVGPTVSEPSQGWREQQPMEAGSRNSLLVRGPSDRAASLRAKLGAVDREPVCKAAAERSRSAG